jgi:carbonic anhydrase
MPPTSALASDACLAALAARRAPRGRVPSRSRIPRAETNNASGDVGEDDIRNDTMPANARREPRKAVRLARRAMLAAPPALVAGAAVLSADAAAPGEWGYADFETGPLRWGEVLDASGARAFPDCGCAACAQSPIDISLSRANKGAFAEGSLADVAVPAKGAVTVAVAQKHGTPNYALVQGVNKTRDVAVGGLDASGGVALDGVPYAFSSLHFHTPAENTLDGAANAMEMHLVHFSSDGSGAIAVLGVLFRYADEENPADKTVERLLADVAADGGKRRVKIEPGALWDGASGYFRWQGSLTTPPCTGGVSWVLQKEVRTVSRAAVKRFRLHLGDGAFPGNARPTQPLNGRAVRAFEPKSA